jgi:NitT/TauT family transport system substrate-binding protein
MLNELRDSFRDGIPSNDTDSMEKAISQAYSILSEIGGKKLVGKSSSLANGTLWNN